MASHSFRPLPAKKCNPCLRYVLLPMSRVAHLSDEDWQGEADTADIFRAFYQSKSGERTVTLEWDR
jgi:hypothetical protein